MAARYFTPHRLINLNSPLSSSNNPSYATSTTTTLLPSFLPPKFSSFFLVLHLYMQLQSVDFNLRMQRDTQVSMTVDDYEAAPDSDCESSSGSGLRRFEEFARKGMVRVEEDGGEYGVVEKSFLAGMGNRRERVNVVAVHKNCGSGVTGQARMEAFRLFKQAAAAKRGGDANVKYAWYGCARDEVLGIVAHGFGRCGEFEDGVSHGIGVYLSPANVSSDSAMKAKEDEHGVRHMLLCRVILGNSETIAAGSRQFQPSSANFDSGIDNPLSPTKYTIWSAYMNSHIFPNYIISFTSPSFTVSGRANLANSPRMEFPALMKVLSRFLSPSEMALVTNCYNNFRDKIIGRPQLIRRLRSLVGDEMLISVIKLCRDERV